MASGAESVKDISSRANISSSSCGKIVEDMEHKGLIQKEVSSGVSRRAVYTISSNLIRFFFEVVHRYTHQVEFEAPEDAFTMARADIDAYMERGFKTVCMDYVTFNYDYTFIGKLRRKDDSRDSVIDFVASVTVDDVRRIIIARCRLFGDPFNKSDLDILMERGKKVDGSNKLYALFSGPGFDPDLQAVARDDSNVVLRTLDEVYKG